MAKTGIFPFSTAFGPTLYGAGFRHRDTFTTTLNDEGRSRSPASHLWPTDPLVFNSYFGLVFYVWVNQLFAI